MDEYETEEKRSQVRCGGDAEFSAVSIERPCYALYGIADWSDAFL